MYAGITALGIHVCLSPAASVQEESLAMKEGESNEDRDKRLARNLYMRFSRSLKSAWAYLLTSCDALV